MFTIQLALMRTARVNVNVSDHYHSAVSTGGPESAKVASVESHYSAAEAVWIKVIVKDKIRNPCSLALAVSE